MPRKSDVMTPAEHRAYMARHARLSAQTDISILAGLDAAERGEDIGAAIRAVNVGFDPRFASGDPATRLPAPDIPLDAMPHLSGEGWTADHQRTFLTLLAATGCVSDACAAVGRSRQSAYVLRRRSASSMFAVGWTVAIHIARQALLDEATERAFRGRETAIWYHGEQVGTRIVHNDRLLMHLLGRQHDPVHPVLSGEELIQLFPAMLKVVDTVMPPFSAERITEIVAEGQDAADAAFY